MSTAVAERKRPKQRKRPKRAANLCTALKRNGEPCTRTKKKGMDICASHARTAHRPTKFTDDVKKKVIAALGTGVSRKDAAIYAGVSESVLGDWIGSAVQARNAGVEDQYTQFLAEIEQAEVGLKMLVLGRAVDGTKKDPRLGLEYAGRKWPGEWGRTDTRQHDHSGTVNVTHLLGGRDPADVPIEARERIDAILVEHTEERE